MLISLSGLTLYSIRYHINTLRRKFSKHPTAVIRIKIENHYKLKLQAKIDYEASLVSSCANNSNNIKYINVIILRILPNPPNTISQLLPHQL